MLWIYYCYQGQTKYNIRICGISHKVPTTHPTPNFVKKAEENKNPVKKHTFDICI